MDTFTFLSVYLQVSGKMRIVTTILLILCSYYPFRPSTHSHFIHLRHGVPDVVVQPPVKRLRMSDSGDSDTPWLKEVHSKIWNRGDLEQKLFRKVKVTRAHYDELQVTLDRKYPGRNDPEYDGRSHKVLSDKLEHLNLIAGGHVFPPRDRVDDESEIDSFFPFTLTYLDFSILELENKSERCPLPLFIRQEYNHLSKLIDKEPQSGAGSVIVSGQPGTGEVVVSLSRRV